MQNELTQMSATSVVALFKTTKEQRTVFADQVINAVAENESNPLEIHLQIKAMEDIIEQIKTAPKYRDAVIAEAEKHGKKFTLTNAKIDIREVGTKYDFSKTNDVKIFELQTQSETIKGKLKERETFLKTIPAEGLVVTDPETGETETIYPPSKSSTTSVVVTLL